MENRIRIKEAIAFARREGKKIKKQDLASRIFTYTTPRSAVVRLYNYETGKSTTMDPRQVRIICKELGVDANFLFGTTSMLNINTENDGKEKPTESAGSL
jgi:transcriptional regulator with XRE-family HTH domain